MLEKKSQDISAFFCFDFWETPFATCLLRDPHFTKVQYFITGVMHECFEISFDVSNVMLDLMTEEQLNHKVFPDKTKPGRQM